MHTSHVVYNWCWKMLPLGNNPNRENLHMWNGELEGTSETTRPDGEALHVREGFWITVEMFNSK